MPRAGARQAWPWGGTGRIASSDVATTIPARGHGARVQELHSRTMAMPHWAGRGAKPRRDIVREPERLAERVMFMILNYHW